MSRSRVRSGEIIELASKYLKILIISVFKDLKEDSSKRKEMETLKRTK